MKEVLQTKVFPPEHPFLGNSFQACVASILEKDIEDIPPFGEAVQFVWDDWEAWLKDNNLVSGIIPINPKYIMLNPDFVDGAIIGYKILTIGGREKRSALVIEKGRITHDPDNTGQPVDKLVSSGVFLGKIK